MALHRVNISAITSHPPKEYKMEDINGAWSRDWQESPIFANIPVGGGYRCLVRDAEACVTEHLIDYEPPLEILAYGAYIHDGSIGVTCAVNTPSEMRLRWDVSVAGEEYEPDMSNINDMGWNNMFEMAHTRYLPYYYIGAIHHYWISVRSKWGQRADVNGRYVITPEALDPIRRFVRLNVNFEKVEPIDLSVEINGNEFNAIAQNTNPDSYIYPHIDVGIVVEKTTINKEINEEITALVAEFQHIIE